MRDDEKTNFVPVTVDELMYHFCTTERRKEIKNIQDAHKSELMKDSLHGKTDSDVRYHVLELLFSIFDD